MSTNEVPARGTPHRPQPYIPDSANLRELTLVPVIVGTLLGIVFGASSLYLVLKVGLTVSASIPVAVISLALFRVWSKLGRKAFIACSLFTGIIAAFVLLA